MILVKLGELHKIKFTKNYRLDQGIEPRLLALLSGTLTITPECFLCLYEAVIESYSCMDSVIHLIG